MSTECLHVKRMFEFLNLEYFAYQVFQIVAPHYSMLTTQCSRLLRRLHA